MKIDLSKFKKIDVDDKCTTLEHPSGHQIKVAHHGLSPEVRKNLEEIPMHLAKGGKLPVLPGHKRNEIGKIVPEKGSKAAQAAGSSNTMYGSPKEAKNNFTEPQDQGTDVVLAALHKEAPPFGPAGEPKFHSPPCINPSCKSYGHPHPNCRCYGGKMQPVYNGMQGKYAEGGKVDYYCSEDRPHDEGCEYYKGGEVKGVHQSAFYHPKDKSDEGMSEAGQKVRTHNTESAKKSHEHVLAESYQMPKPKLKGLAEGGSPEMSDTQGQAQNPEPTPEPQVAQDTQPTTPEQQPQDPNAPPTEADPYAQIPPDVNSAQYANSLMHDESNKFYSDVDAGHIQPKTYKDLFADKSLPGKIGTIFGMMIGGGGAGLAGQDNVLMGMMNKEIERDLQAQEASAKNKQSFMTINGNNLTQLANSGKVGAETRAMQIALAKDQMNYSFYNELAQYTQKLPEGPVKQQALQKLALLGNAMVADKASAFAQAAHASALANQFGGGNTTAMKSGLMGPEMKEAGADIEQKRIEGVPGLANRPINQGDRDELQAMNVLNAKSSDLLNFIKQHRGTLNPQQRKVAAQKAEEMVNYYNSSIQGGVLTQGRLKWLDNQINKNPLSIVNDLMGNSARLQEIKNSNDMRRQLKLKSYGLKEKQSAPSESKNKPATIKQNGHTFTLNPQSGQYE